MKDVKNGIFHLYNPTNEFQRRVAYGYAEIGSVFTSLSSWETFNNETEWKARLLQLGVEIQEMEDVD